MRTTITLEPDVAARLKELGHRRRVSFKEVVNSVLRRGLAAQERSAATKRPRAVATFRSAFRAGIDPVKLNQLNDDLEVGERRPR